MSRDAANARRQGCVDSSSRTPTDTFCSSVVLGHEDDTTARRIASHWIHRRHCSHHDVPWAVVGLPHRWQRDIPSPPRCSWSASPNANC